MTSAAKKLLEQREAPEGVARAWDEEVRRRIRAAERGETSARDWDEVYRELRAKHLGG